MDKNNFNRTEELFPVPPRRRKTGYSDYRPSSEGGEVNFPQTSGIEKSDKKSGGYGGRDFPPDFSEEPADNNFSVSDSLGYSSGVNTAGYSLSPESLKVLNSSKSDKPRKKRRLPSSKKKKTPLTAEQKKELRRKRKISIKNWRNIRFHFLKLIASVVLAAAVVGLSVWGAFTVVGGVLDFTGIAPKEEEIIVTIPPHATTYEISGILAARGVIESPKLFEMWSRYSDADGAYLSGTFTLSTTMSYGRIINVLQTANTEMETVSVRIPEGSAAYETAKLLEENEVCYASDFMEYIDSKPGLFDFEQRLKTGEMKTHMMEGYLYPDTYEFYKFNPGFYPDPAERSEAAKNAAEDAAFKIFENFDSHMTKEIYRGMYDITYGAGNEKHLLLEEFLTLASIVSAEAATQEDMELVASVFINRLKDPENFPLLESDATDKYRDRLEAEFKERGEVLPRNIADAYDTYEYAGLTPGPIGSVGEDAMRAVVNAPDTDYYFFAANINTGKVYYAKTNEEHEANLEKVRQEIADAQNAQEATEPEAQGNE